MTSQIGYQRRVRQKCRWAEFKISTSMLALKGSFREIFTGWLFLKLIFYTTELRKPFLYFRLCWQRQNWEYYMYTYVIRKQISTIFSWWNSKLVSGLHISDNIISKVMALYFISKTSIKNREFNVQIFSGTQNFQKFFFFFSRSCLWLNRYQLNVYYNSLMRTQREINGPLTSKH